MARLRVLSHLPLPLLARVREAFPDVDVEGIPERGPLAEGLRGEVLLTQAWGSPNLERVLARGVRWVHAYGTGVDAFPLDALGGRVLTCSRGASAVPIAEWVLAALLCAEKRLPESWIHEPPRRWSAASLGGLEGRELGLVGLGGIGRAVAVRALAFGMRVRAHRRSNAPPPIAGVERAEALDDLLAGADHLVLAAPTTRETRGLIGEAALARVKRGVHLVNVARGGLVDHEALRRALDDGRVGLATLDCVEPEPLPAGHWLYHHPRVRLSPHVSWSGPLAFDRLIEPFLENLRRYRAGEPLAHVVDLALGY
jgi:phosphoglycerate dehydrogenase-like enzyme